LELKKKVAIIIPAGIKGGDFNQGIPALNAYIEGISIHYEVTVFSMILTDASFRPEHYKYLQTGAKITDSGFKKIVLLTWLFFKENKKSRFKLIHGIWGMPSGFISVLLGKIFSIPSIVSLQGGEAAYLPEIGYGNLLSIKKRKLTMWTCDQTTELTALTKFQINELNKFGFRRNEVSIIPYGVDQQLFIRQDKILESPFNFIHIGNLTEVKDQFMLLKAFKIIADSSESFLRIVGDGSCLNELKHLTKELDIEKRVQFKGAISNDNIPKELDWAHFLLHSSLYEGQAVVAVEAAASGVVVCGTKVGILADWGESKCVAVPISDYYSLAEKVLELMKNSVEYQNLQKNAYKWTIENGQQKVVSSFQKIYEKLLV
jgi:glycosyltransferase involved in cell wall biosynthesis